MPSYQWMDIPMVFRNISRDFSRCHISKMTRPEFLSGEWCGHRCGHMLDHIDPPIHDLILNTRSLTVDDLPAPPGEVLKTVIEDSKGRQSFMEFRLSGYIYASGKVALTKMSNTQLWAWEYKGAMTPFGIAGIWGNGREIVGGYCWIWKKQWCE